MTHYAENPGSVRVEFFKPGGKWYMTEAWDMSRYWNFKHTPIDAVEAMLKDDARGARLLTQFIVVVQDPYHVHEYPVCLVPGMQGHE